MAKNTQIISLRSWIYKRFKRLFDIVFSLVMLVVLSPIFLLVFVLIKLDDGGSVIHKRICVGKNGPYIMYKFRTMKMDADCLERYFTESEIEQYKKETKVKNDPRVTNIGAFLRKTSIDELPQLFSVLMGSMSIVGPRPIVEAEKVNYGENLDELLSVKPGITGYWQCHGRAESTYESGRRQALELYYVRNQSLLLDLKILLLTPMTVVRGGGGILKDSVSRGQIYHILKRLFDFLASLALVILLMPLFLIIAALIKLDDGGPSIHKRICVGKNGPYVMYKFRTMRVDADNLTKYFDKQRLEAYLRGEKDREDPRITKIGRFLRRTSLDELPQLYSVLCNSMSLIGPRPVIEREADSYGADRDLLLSCKPGITGYLQVNGRGLAFLSDRAKELQLYYVRHQSLLLDIQILLKTVKVVLGGEREGAK